MGDKTGIEWADATWNPIVGCSVVSPGCTNCYAMRQAARIQRMNGDGSHYFGTTRTVDETPVWTGKLTLAPDAVLAAPLRWKRPRRIFVNSMGDLFHEDAPFEWIDRVFAVMALSTQHTFQVLSKRPALMREYLSAWFERLATRETFVDHPVGRANFARIVDWSILPSILPNLWLGVSAEDQRRADERVPDLLATPAAVRFVSAEPLLGAIDFAHITHSFGLTRNALTGAWHAYPISPGPSPTINLRPPKEKLDWIIVGGESGRSARPMHPDWARSIRDQCAAEGVPFFFKQWGEFVVPFDGERSCRICGCTEQWACEPSSCSWVESDLCSACVGGSAPAQRAVKFRRVGRHRAGRMLDGCAHDAFPGALSLPPANERLAP